MRPTHATLATKVQNRDRERELTYTNLTQELDNGIIVICQVKTVGYDVDDWQIVVAHRISVLQAKIKLCSRPMIVNVHVD